MYQLIVKRGDETVASFISKDSDIAFKTMLSFAETEGITVVLNGEHTMEVTEDGVITDGRDHRNMWDSAVEVWFR